MVFVGLAGITAVVKHRILGVGKIIFGGKDGDNTIFYSVYLAEL